MNQSIKVTLSVTLVDCFMQKASLVIFGKEMKLLNEL